MRADPFPIDRSRRVLAHPDTPAAYVEWAEILPLTGEEDRTHLGNLLGWSLAAACAPLGAARDIFEHGFLGISDDVLDAWMISLADTPIEDFIDHHVPFLRNVFAAQDDQPARGARIDALVRVYIESYLASDAAAPASLADRELRRPMPEAVHIEITRSCNFACGMCSSRTGGFLPSRTMPLPVFGELVRVLGPSARTLRINGYGETTLVPRLPGYLDCLDEFAFVGIREIITNLSAPDAVYSDLVDRGFVVMVSWDATSAQLFESLRAGARYDEMVPRLRMLGNSLRTERQRLILLSTIQEANLHEIVPLVRFASDVGAGLVIFNMVNEPDGSPWMAPRFQELREHFDAAMRLASELGVDVRVPDHVGKQRLRLRGTKRSSATFCDRPWRELMVRWDTEATVCNMFNPFSYGMLRRPGPARDVHARLRRLWGGPNAALFRRIINTEQLHPYCRDCYFLHS